MENRTLNKQVCNGFSLLIRNGKGYGCFDNPWKSPHVCCHWLSGIIAKYQHQWDGRTVYRNRLQWWTETFAWPFLEVHVKHDLQKCRRCTFFHIYPLTIMTQAVIHFHFEKCPAVCHSSILVTFSHWGTNVVEMQSFFKTLTRANCLLSSTIFVLSFEGRVPKHINNVLNLPGDAW